MKWLRRVSYPILIALLAGATVGPPIAYAAPAALAQSSDAGVFGFRQADWDASFTFVDVQSDGFLVYQLNDGGNLYIRTDDQGNTTYVEYELGESLSLSDAEAFVQGELLPDDAEAINQHQDIMVGGDRQRVTVHLFSSDTLVQLLPGYAGVILVAYGQDEGNFSVSIA